MVTAFYYKIKEDNGVTKLVRLYVEDRWPFKEDLTEHCYCQVLCVCVQCALPVHILYTIPDKSVLFTHDLPQDRII